MCLESFAIYIRNLGTIFILNYSPLSSLKQYALQLKNILLNIYTFYS